MSSTTYTVEIPPIHYLLLGLETAIFKHQDPQGAKLEALSYLTKVLRAAVEKEIIEIWDFENEVSADLKKITDLESSIYREENGILNFERILQCKIKYTFNNYIIKNAVFNRHRHGSPSQKIASYGFFALIENQSDKPSRSTVIKIKNEERESSGNPFVRKRNENMNLNYFEKLKIQEAKQLYFDQNNNYQKEILNTNSFLALERIFLSFQNTFIITKYLFVPEHFHKNATAVIDLLVQTFSPENEYEFHTAVEIEGVKFYVYKHDPVSCALTFSKTGKLYIRDQNGVKEVDENTTFSDLTDMPAIDQKLQNIIEII
ncbi:hypothetical protein [Kaistella yonginensis]|uniref:hypothetical protein n=1 Tax=Kaistella yonginensis TaxID=658267 RepID=UPI0025B38956|nr:hypothetical protein [Kaistella yonginensis]MDN3606772.1 hypothetical protein [Kaistella yonginensis]